MNPGSCIQIMTQADLGLADSYINGDFSFVDKSVYAKIESKTNFVSSVVLLEIFPC